MEEIDTILQLRIFDILLIAVWCLLSPSTVENERKKKPRVSLLHQLFEVSMLLGQLLQEQWSCQSQNAL